VRRRFAIFVSPPFENANRFAQVDERRFQVRGIVVDLGSANVRFPLRAIDRLTISGPSAERQPSISPDIAPIAPIRNPEMPRKA
jgi:hypothetical protein